MPRATPCQVPRSSALTAVALVRRRDLRALSSRQLHTGDAAGGYGFVETLQLPVSGGMVTVQAELVGDGMVAGEARGSSRPALSVFRLV